MADATYGGPTHLNTNSGQIAIRAVHVEVTEGPDAGRRERVAKPSFMIGSGELADLRLADPTISREHVRLHLSAHGVVIRDESSRNGTWIGGLRVHNVALTSGARLTLGSTTITLHVDADVSEVPVSVSGHFGDALGSSAAMRVVFGLLEKAAPTDLTVLLEGESGVGKEVLARAVHSRSARAQGPFVAVDCGAIPPNLIESELFGHVRGAFTGAAGDREGLFAEANGGTLFLDEIGELPLDMQPKLLRALEQREIRPVGSNRPRAIDVRIVAATNRQLSLAVQRGEFREDLLYRISVVRVAVPPLRDRADDIVPIARSFLATAAKDPSVHLPPEVEAMLVTYQWPGNVRELRNVVQRFAALGMSDAASLLADGTTRAGAAVPGLAAPELMDLPYQEARQQVMDEFDRRYLSNVLDRNGGVVVKAAERAGLARATFYRMLERLQLTGRGR